MVPLAVIQVVPLTAPYWYRSKRHNGTATPLSAVNTNSGHSIGVYNPETKDKKKVYKMLSDNRIKYFAPADYTPDSELDKLVKAIIDRTASNEKLMSIHYENQRELANEKVKKVNGESVEKEKLIMALETSNSFARTHSVISKLKNYDNWTDEEKQWLKKIVDTNKQVSLIKDDEDVASFFSSL